MALFESKQRRLFKMIKTMSDGGAVDQAAARVEQDLKVLLETPEMARELVAFLMDIGYPDLAARAGEEIIRLYKDLAVPVLRLLEERQGDFPRSFELLRTLWQIKLRQRDYNGAIELLNRVDRTAENKLFDSLESSARNAERFATDKLLEGDLDRFLSWSLAQFRKGRVQEAMDTLLKAAQKSARPDERIPSIVEWITTRKGERDPLGVLYLVRVFLAFENAEFALRNLPDLFDAPPEIVQQALSVVEKDLIPLDLTTKSRIYLARLLSSAERFDDSCRELEKLFEEGEQTLDLDSAIRDLASRASANARPQLLLARFKKSRGESTAALDALEKAFACEDASQSPIGETAGEFLEAGIDRDDTIARMLSELMVEQGSVGEAVHALCRVVSSDPEWVQAMLQKLLQKDKNSAEILTLLAVTMQVRGRESEANATMRHLQERRDKKSREDIVQVLSRFDSLMEKYPGLRRMRASVRGEAGREGEAASDWFSLLLSGEKVPERGLEEIREAGLHRKRATELLSSAFEPESPREALLGGVAALSVADYAKADELLIRAASDPALTPVVAGQIAVLPDSALQGLTLSRILPTFAESGSAQTAADIILRTTGSETWRMDLVSRLSWGDPPAEMLFRLRAFLSEGKTALAGRAAGSEPITDRALNGLADFCRMVSEGDMAGALGSASDAVEDRRTSSLAGGVLMNLLDQPGSHEVEIRKLLARAASTEGRIPDATGWLEPVLSSQGVTDLLEEFAAAAPGLVDAPLMLLKAASMQDDFDRLRRFASTALDIDPGRAAEIASLCEKKGMERGSGHCLAYAAELSDRYHLSLDPDMLLTNAVLADPSMAAVASSRKGTGPGLKALCALASANAAAFADTMRRRSGLTVQLNAAIADIAIGAWKAGRDDEALSHLADLLRTAGLFDREVVILSALASEGIGAWRTTASEKLLALALEEKIPQNLFWDSVKDPAVVEKALEGPLGSALEKSRPEQVSAAAGAVLSSGLGVERLMDFGEMLLDSEDGGARLKDIATAGFARWRTGDRTAEADLARLLVAAGMFGEASELAWARMDDKVFALLRAKLSEARAGAAGAGSDTARLLLLAGNPSGALEALGSLDGPLERDLRATALWRMGRRNAALASWLEAWRATGAGMFIERLHWALGEAGYTLDRSALERFAETRHQAVLPRLRRRQGDGGRLGMISSL